MQFSPQQETIFDFVENRTGSGKVVAVAGAGKTTTLVEAVSRMKGNVAFCAYNKKIADEITLKLRAAGAPSTCRAGTFHSFGFLAWRRVASTVKVDDKKLFNLCTQIQMPEQYETFARKAVSLAKQRAIGVLTPMADTNAWMELIRHFELEEHLTAEGCEVDLEEATQQGLNWACKLLKASAQQDREVIDFDDMIYAPLLHNARVFQNDWVLIDEAQDTNPARRALAKKMLRPGGRLLAVGDPCQAIYGFTGADADSFDKLTQEFGCVELPLTTTYRCPKSVVRHAQQWVSHINAHESAPEGVVSSILDVNFHTLAPMDLTAADAVLCRNTKPLVELAYHFIRRSIPCHVEGRDIGAGLMALANKWKAKSLSALQNRLELYLEKETEKLMSKGQETKAEALADKVDTLFVIMGSLPPDSDVNALRAQIDKLFSDTPDGKPSPNLTLSTIHKSKGREWDRVYLFGRNKYMPSKFARQMWQLEQEKNLCYVAVTRAKQTLVEVEVTN